MAHMQIPPYHLSIICLTVAEQGFINNVCVPMDGMVAESPLAVCKAVEQVY